MGLERTESESSLLARAGYPSLESDFLQVSTSESTIADSSLLLLRRKVTVLLEAADAPPWPAALSTMIVTIEKDASSKQVVLIVVADACGVWLLTGWGTILVVAELSALLSRKIETNNLGAPSATAPI